MQTALTEAVQSSDFGAHAESILRACVHCGFCLATCPTYHLLGDERDSPRGRIYLIKQVLEGQPVSARTRLHLDRCLTCRACETTCPSGVQYAQLLDAGRHQVAARVGRPVLHRLLRALVRAILPFPSRVGLLVRAGQAVRPILPRGLRAKIPARQQVGPLPETAHRRMMILHEGCVQPSLAPCINGATTRVLDRLGIGVLRAKSAGCCGALSHHLDAPDEGLEFARRNIDAWWPLVEQGAEAIVSNASGCGVMVKDYGRLLAQDPAYRDKARRISELTRDIGEVLAGEDLDLLRPPEGSRAIAYHPPCTLQHGQKLPGLVEKLLERAGFSLTHVPDKHLCCGSAGTYSIFQSKLANALRERKISALEADRPELIVTANIGCQLHLQAASSLPVRHWIELFDPAALPADQEL